MSVAPVAHANEPANPAPSDPFLWLEDVEGKKALDWVHEHDAVVHATLADTAAFREREQHLRAIYDSKEKIPFVAVLGGYYYNFWQDAEHVRGIWRRTTPDEFRKAAPHWDVLIDVDALGAKEHESWVWQGAQCLFPDYRRCLVLLSRAGGDSHVVREFDIGARQFVEGGFELPEAKSDVGWIDADTIFVGTDFGAGSMTDSGYARVVKRWKRGTPLSEATTAFEAQQKDVAAAAAHVRTWVDGKPVWHDILSRQVTFFTSEQYLVVNGQPLRLSVPDDAEVSLFADQILVRLRSAWTIEGHAPWPAGALLAAPLGRFLAGARDFTMLYTPGARKSLADFADLKSGLLLHELDTMQNHLYFWAYHSGQWQRQTLDAPAFAELSIAAVDSDYSDDYFVTSASPTQPTTLGLASPAHSKVEPLKANPAFFDATGVAVAHYDVASRDGTLIPYFVVTPAGFTANGSAPTMLYGYGGFEISLLPPGYSGGLGAEWIARGGVFVLAGLRGGGEYGPAWHDAAIREKKQKSYDDMIAIAEDLIKRGITSPRHLGISGGSNGGLMVAAVMVQRPDLFAAVVCQSPLLDMRRYQLLLAGASWMGEYGARRPGAPGTCAQDGRPDGTAGSRRAVLREHRGRARGGGRQRPGSLRHGPELYLPLQGATLGHAARHALRLSKRPDRRLVRARLRDPGTVEAALGESKRPLVRDGHDARGTRAVAGHADKER
jgi:prolyl oligopeptidase